MCGIAGAVSLNAAVRPSLRIVENLTKSLHHRGPNGSGVWVAPSGRAILGHSRLSIIDLEGGQQPMVARSGNMGLVFNGEVYNYLELRAGLNSDGAIFRTRSDTEVLLQLLEARGVSGIQDVRGMFAAALWDDRSGQLTLVRDRLGKKPLYYRIVDDTLYFASSLRSLRQNVPGPWEIDFSALDQYLALGYVPAPKTIYKGTSKVPSATIVSGQLQSAQIASQQFWSARSQIAPFRGSYTEAKEELERVLVAATQIRLRSDVPLGLFLSGGVDSSLVSAIAASESSRSLEAFTIAFDSKTLDESVAAGDLSQRLGIRHHVLRVSSRICDVLPDMVSHFGEPHSDYSALPMWHLSQQSSPHITVALSGDGGDEGFGGYLWYQNHARMSRLAKIIRPSIARLMMNGMHQLGLNGQHGNLMRLSRALAVLGAKDDADRFSMLRTLFTDIERKQLWATERCEGVGNPREIVAAFWRSLREEPIKSARLADLHFYLADDILPKVDVTSMAYGLEVRSPLLDHEVLSFGLGLPYQHLFDQRGGKKILRDLLLRRLPGAHVNGPKRGFTPPVGEWLTSELRERLMQLTCGGSLDRLGYFRPNVVRRWVDEHLDGRRDHAQRLYALIVLDEWLSQESAMATPEHHMEHLV